MSETSKWVKVTRENGEIVGYIEPLTEDYGTVQPRTVLGHSLGHPCEYIEGEDLLIEHGIAELAEQWTLDRGTDREISDLTIVELSPPTKSFWPTIWNQKPWSRVTRSPSNGLTFTTVCH